MSFRDPGTGRIFDLRDSRDQKEVNIMVKIECHAVLLFKRELCVWDPSGAPNAGRCAWGGRGFVGIWIGLQFTSGEHMEATSDGRVIRARAIHPRPDTVKITKEALTNIRVGPWSPSEIITQGSVGRPSPMT